MGTRLKRGLAVSAVALLALAGAWQLALGTWIPVKAALAQVLLERAWQRTVAGQAQAKPWPWADTWPVALLELGGERMVVLADGGGQSLAFGPSHVAATSAPGAAGVSVLAGHRDTHFRRLQAMTRGGEFTLVTADGRRRRYQVRESRVLPRPELAPPPTGEGESWLVLATCWPFDALRAGGRERFVVLAGPPLAESPDRGHVSATIPGKIRALNKGGAS